MWFEKLMGFREESLEQVRHNLTLEGTTLHSKINGNKFRCGVLETPSLADLRKRVGALKIPEGKISVAEIVGDAQALHANANNDGALFQVASQFNLLEMPGPEVTPERGVGCYENDRTQGPACAVAAGAGTIYRNYFIPVHGKVGQSADNQVDCLAGIGMALGNSVNRLWEMSNGYAMASENGLVEIDEKLRGSDKAEIDALRGLLQIGIQWDTQVTLGEAEHHVSQAYCSALPVGYSELPPDLWARFAQLVLEASYEATICAGILNFIENGNNTVFLTLIGGGVFGNKMDWVLGAMKRSLNIYKNVGLDVKVVSFGRSKNEVLELTKTFG